jgi:energy-coupling factor transport system ATP-binding protein
MPAETTGSNPAIELNGVHFTYPRSKQPALNGIDLSIKKGEFVMIMGRTGSGKTSLVRTINRIIPQFFKGEFTGSVRIFGNDIENKSVASMAPQVGMVFQDFESQLFSTNIVLDLVFGPENMGVPTADIARRMDWILDTFELRHLVHRDPATLSGGEKQRLAIAGILMLDPPVIILDEPTTDLDPESREKVYSMLENLRNKGITILLIDHSPEYAQCADRIILLNNGQVTADRSPSDFIVHSADFTACGIRIPQLVECAQKLGISDDAVTPSELAELIRRSGITPDQERYETLCADELQASERYPILTVENLSFGYSDQPVLKSLDLSIYSGDFLALIGQNGSGKTTLAKHFNGLLNPCEGTVKFEGNSLLSLDTAKMAGNVGYVFQNPDHQIFSPTVREEVIFGPLNLGLSEKEAEVRVVNALETVGLHGYDDRDPFMLTKGESQRLAVASVLAMHPRVIILDEPTTGLDHPDQIRMMDLLAALNRNGHTVIMITHSMTMTMQYANRAMVMKNGNILADGYIRDIFSQTDQLEEAGLKPPPITRLGLEFGQVIRSVDEFVGLCSKNSVDTQA